MKKFTLILIMAIGFSAVFAQSAKVQSAYNYLKNGKLDKAKQNIDLAAEHEKTMGKAKTWFYKGNIYLNIQMTDNEEYKTLSDNPLQVAYEAYRKTAELDDKDEFTEQLKINMVIVGEQFYNAAVAYFNQEDYIKAMEKFLTAKEINESFGGYDTLATYNAAICAEYGGDLENAKKLYSDLIEEEFDQPVVYASMINIMKEEENYEKAKEIVEKARQKFPADYNIIISATNLYLATEESNKALEMLEKALEIEQNNPTIFFAVGSQYNIIVDDTTKEMEVRNNAFNSAEKAYKNAIELDPEYFDANYNLGALYVNKAAEIIQIANELPLDETEKYQELKSQADQMLSNALPYLEKASSINPDDINTLVSLKEIYTRLAEYEKLKIVNEKLENE